MIELPILYKRSTNGKVTTWQIFINNNEHYTTTGYIDGVKTQSQPTICSGKNVGKKNETTPEQQALAEAQAMWTKKVELGSYESIDDIDTPKFFNPMLAHKFEDYKDKIEYPVYSQPKLDGIRCIVRADGKFDKCFEISEYQNDIEGLLKCFNYLQSNSFTMVGFNNINFDYPRITQIFYLH